MEWEFAAKGGLKSKVNFFCFVKSFSQKFKSILLLLQTILILGANNGIWIVQICGKELFP